MSILKFLLNPIHTWMYNGRMYGESEKEFAVRSWNENTDKDIRDMYERAMMDIEELELLEKHPHPSLMSVHNEGWTHRWGKEAEKRLPKIIAEMNKREIPLMTWHERCIIRGGDRS